MPITRYLGTRTAFGPETISAMSKALEDAVTALRIGDDKAKREVVARLIIGLAESAGDLDAAALRDRVVDALSDQTLFMAIMKDRKLDAHRT